MTQKQKIGESLASGMRLTTLSAAISGLGVKAQTRICELERDSGIRMNRTPKKNVITGTRWLEYQCPVKKRFALKLYLKKKYNNIS